LVALDPQPPQSGANHLKKMMTQTPVHGSQGKHERENSPAQDDDALSKTGLGVLVDKARIQTLIPHAGAMCLLEAVTAWDEAGIVCVTQTHRDPANPLRRQDRLAMSHACEYGAQAAAIHGGLRAQAAGQSAPAGYLAALRDVRWFAADLAAVDAPLEVAAHLVLGDADYCIYAIQVSAAGQTLAEARITIAPQPKNGACS